MSKSQSESSSPNEMGDKCLSNFSFHKILCNQLEKLENGNSDESKTPLEFDLLQKNNTPSSVNDVQKVVEKSKFKVGKKRVNIFFVSFFSYFLCGQRDLGPLSINWNVND